MTLLAKSGKSASLILVSILLLIASVMALRWLEVNNVFAKSYGCTGQWEETYLDLNEDKTKTLKEDRAITLKVEALGGGITFNFTRFTDVYLANGGIAGNSISSLKKARKESTITFNPDSGVVTYLAKTADTDLSTGSVEVSRNESFNGICK